MLGLGETLDLRRGLLRAVISLRSLEDYYRPIVFSVAGQTTPRDNHIGASQQRFRFAPHDMAAYRVVHPSSSALALQLFGSCHSLRGLRAPQKPVIRQAAFNAGSALCIDTRLSIKHFAL